MEEKKTQDCMVCGHGLEYLASSKSVTCIAKEYLDIG